MNINMNGKPSKTELASKTCNVVSCADFNIGDIDGYGYEQLPYKDCSINQQTLIGNCL